MCPSSAATRPCTPPPSPPGPPSPGPAHPQQIRYLHRLFPGDKAAQVRCRELCGPAEAQGFSWPIAPAVCSPVISALVTRLTGKGGAGACVAGEVIYWKAAGCKHTRAAFDGSPGPATRPAPC